MDAEKIKVRKDLDLFPVQSADRTLIVIKDKLGLVEQDRAISPELYKVMIMLDGANSLRDVQIELMRHQGGRLVSMEEVEELVKQLDNSFLLDSPRYRDAKRKIVDRFTAQRIRSCSLAGLSYPERKEDLRRRLEEILNTQALTETPQGKITALVAPHIDLEAGKRVYSSAYQTLRHGAAVKRVIVLGVGHSLSEGMFSLTTKTFETPLGRVETDVEMVRELMKAGGDILSADDFVHRDEHSIEFQVIFLQHILGGSSFVLVPVLCGSVLASLPLYTREAYRSKGGRFLQVLADAAKDDETILVAGVDFSHVGQKFGHDMPASLMVNESEKHDRALLHFLCDGNANGFWGESIKVEDKFNVCGFSALACLLEVLPGGHGKLLAYETYREEPTKSAVSFAAVIFTESSS